MLASLAVTMCPLRWKPMGAQLSMHWSPLRIASMMSAALCCSATSATELDRQAASWASSCISCHAPNARDTSPIPSLNGRDATDIEARMQAFSTQTPAVTLMAQLARGYTNAEIHRIAQWFSRQPKATAP